MRERRFILLSVGLMALAPALAGADGGCSPGDVPIGRDPDAGAAGGGNRDGVSCGPVVCAAGEVCCNRSCGVCTPPGGACTTEVCEDTSCSDTTQAIRDLLEAHRRCASDADCTTVNVSCLPSENCTGNAYVNRSIDQRALTELTRDLNTCVNGRPDLGCPVCDRFDPPPVCVEGVCAPPPVSDPPRPEEPCAGKVCGEECSTCVPGEPCRAILEFCDGNGQCGGSVPCRDPGDPCAGKVCGEQCSTCVEGQPCLAILEFCGHDGACSSAAPRCP